jgi:hypothetical protein
MSRNVGFATMSMMELIYMHNELCPPRKNKIQTVVCRM